MQPRREGMIWQIVGLLVVIAAALEIRSAAQQFTATFSQKYAGEMDIDEERAPLGPLREAALFLFWLLFVFIGLSLLPTEPIGGAIFIILPTYGFSMAAMGMHRGRVEALRKVEMKRERAAKRLGAEKHEN